MGLQHFCLCSVTSCLDSNLVIRNCVQRGKEKKPFLFPKPNNNNNKTKSPPKHKQSNKQKPPQTTQAGGCGGEVVICCCERCCRSSVPVKHSPGELEGVRAKAPLVQDQQSCRAQSPAEQAGMAARARLPSTASMQYQNLQHKIPRKYKGMW